MLSLGILNPGGVPTKRFALAVLLACALILSVAVVPAVTTVRAATNSPPVITGFGPTESPGVVLIPEIFVISISDADGDMMTYTVFYGDGSYASGTGGTGTYYLAHTYRTAGNPVMTLDVTDPYGAEVTSTLTWSILPFAYARAITSIDIHPGSGVPAHITGTYEGPNDWGLWTKQPVWPTDIRFSDVLGYGTPPGCHLDMIAGSTSTCGGVYHALGWLRVVTQPALPATIYVDGVPRDDWGVWTALAPGTHTVSFGAVAGYAPPAPQTVNLVAENTFVVTASYVYDGVSPGPDPSTYGLLRVTTQLDTGTFGLPAQIWVDSIARDDWGLAWVKLSVGCHTIRFSDVPGTVKPADATTCLLAGQTREVTGTYTALGYLHVTTDPPLAASIAAGLDGYSTRSVNDWGFWVAVPAGTYYIAFAAVDGYQEPGVQFATVTAGATTDLVGHYSPLGP